MDEITVSFLSQAFVAICLTFSGLYNLIFAFSAVNNKCFSLPEFEIGKTSSLTVVLQLLYFSISTMTSAGQGDVYPRRWYNFFFFYVTHSHIRLYSTTTTTTTHTHTHASEIQVRTMACLHSNVNICSLYCCIFGSRSDKVERSASCSSNKIGDV